MISALKALFEPVATANEEQRRHRVHLAAAALLIETARSDFNQDTEEQAALVPLLSKALALPPDDVSGLIKAAEASVDEATSLYEFTRVINDNFNADQKQQLIEAMWAVAWVDGDVHRYEEHLIRRAAELTYVPHADYIAAKLSAQRHYAPED